MVAIIKWLIAVGILYCLSINISIATFVFVFLLFALVVPKDIIFWHIKPSKYHAVFYLMLTLMIISVKYNNKPVMLPAQLSCSKKLPNDWNDGKFIFQRIDNNRLSIDFEKDSSRKVIELDVEHNDGHYVLKLHDNTLYYIDKVVHLVSDKYSLQFTVAALDKEFTLNCYGVM